MHWKSWPYWKKGSSLVGGFYLLFIIIAVIFLFLASFSQGDPIGKGFASGIILFLIFFPSSLLVTSNVFNIFFGVAVFVVIPVMQIFLFACVGSFLGYLYGKIKNRERITSG